MKIHTYLLQIQRVSRKAPISVQNNPNLIHPNMSENSQRSLYFIAQAYDMSNLKRLKQLAYRDLLMRQQYLGNILIRCIFYILQILFFLSNHISI